MGGAGGQMSSCVDNGVGEAKNETEGSAHSLGKIDDQNKNGSKVKGVIKGDSDVDWYVYEGEDVVLGQVDPARQITQTESGLRLCKYFECLNGLDKTEVTCKDGAKDDTSPAMRPGCCHSTGFEVDLNCKSTISDDAKVYIRVDQPSATSSTCNEYVISYHF